MKYEICELINECNQTFGTSGLSTNELPLGKFIAPTTAIFMDDFISTHVSKVKNIIKITW